MKKIDEWVGRVSALLAMLAAVCTLAMMATMIADVANRVLGNGSLKGAYELSAMLLVVIVFLGFGYAERTETNVRVTLATSRMPHAVARVVRLVGGIVSTVVVALFARATWDQALVSMDRGEFTQGIVDFPVWPTKLVIAIGFTFLTLECLLGMWRRWTAPSEQDVHPDLPAEAHL
ncbi:TRAP transporter small permease subunit [Nocardioides campestrisoli]|uniref:TRAP transporter small permease subunit n=1 Tax=Nocardioides campestrisoli TaxID=2736757 RepID=UPI00163D8EA7|nr:TRAP transporter small permease [Nocardioides campestrisoli]